MFILSIFPDDPLKALICYVGIVIIAGGIIYYTIFKDTF
jgi:hypothetical protein